MTSSTVFRNSWPGCEHLLRQPSSISSIMDFDDRFLLEDFREHIYGFEEDAVDIDRLITRTTKNTRGGNAFSYKPIRIFIGSSSHSEFFSGFKSDIDSKGPNPHKEEGDPAQVSSSFWIRFGDPEPVCPLFAR